ncbi:MAG: DUF2147 domain-containing protein [Deltaproteobacteria bacterium]|nr:DUF2147 domain-containing protein [Deltaproteobacteria bacterium]
MHHARPPRWLPGLVALVLFLISRVALAAASPEGYWTTIDDETGNKKSVVQIWQDEQGKLWGRIVKLYRQPGEEADPLCDKCQGSLYNQRILGMTILRGLKLDKDEWSGGTILDPNNGKTYSCFVRVIEDGQKLNLRGYIGISLLGRTQTWLRTSKPTDEIEFLK